MKQRLLVLALFFSMSAELFAGNVVRSYLVGTRHPSRQSVERIARGDDSGVGPGRNVEPFDIVDAYRTDLTDAEANALSKSPEVRYIEEDAPRHALGVPRHVAGNELRDLNAQTIPWGVRAVNAPSVWPVTRGASINVAVLDTGIDVKHPDLQAAYAGGFNTYSGETAVPIDDEGHGTHVAGTIAATDNNIGVVGVAPGVHLWAVRVLKSNGNGSASGNASNIIAGIQWVVRQKQSLGGDWIISMSLGQCSSPLITEASAVNSAINAGILIIAAAGNHVVDQPNVCSSSTDNSYAVSYPAAYPGVIAVAAVDSKLNVGDFSNFGPQVAIAGPGVDVLSTVPLGTGSISSVTNSSGTVLLSEPLVGSPRGTLSDVFVNCGLGKAASDFPASVNGHIALIQRGDISFATKVKNAQSAGAAAVIIYNKDDSDISGFTLTADSADAGHVWPLSVAVSLEDGQALLAHPGTVTIFNSADDYDSFDGTSMATPHVTAAAALAWSVAPNVTADTVKQALFSTAHDLGDPGVDNYYGHGLVDALAAAKLLNPGLFQRPVTGRFPGRRGH